MHLEYVVLKNVDEGSVQGGVGDKGPSESIKDRLVVNDPNEDDVNDYDTDNGDVEGAQTDQSSASDHSEDSEDDDIGAMASDTELRKRNSRECGHKEFMKIYPKMKLSATPCSKGPDCPG